MKRITVVLVLVLVTPVIAGCGPSKPSEEQVKRDFTQAYLARTVELVFPGSTDVPAQIPTIRVVSIRRYERNQITAHLILTWAGEERIGCVRYRKRYWHWHCTAAKIF